MSGVTVGDHRIALRVRAELTPEQLAKAAKIAPSTVKNAEAGDMMQERIIRAIAAVLGCTAADYLGPDNPEDRP